MNAEESKALQQMLRELIEFLEEKKVGEFRLERGELKVELKFESAIAAEHRAPAPLPMDPVLLARLMGAAAHGSPAPLEMPGVPGAFAQPSAEGAGQPAQVAAAEALHTVKSPIVGTFYESPSPGSPAFVKPGDHVEPGQPLCIVEAMKLMNEIESDIAGEVVQRLVQNGQPVEYGQPLFAVRARTA